MMRFQILFPPASLTFRLTLTLQCPPPISNDQLLRSQLCKEQHSDPEISPLFERALEENEMSQVPVCYYVKHDILMRKWRPPDVSADDEWTVNHQIVVHRAYRPEILNLVHETPMPGHLGVNKTYHKILNHFFWPELKSDVSQHCKSCHTCQMVGKPNQTIPKAYLQPIPAFDEPFSRIIIDCLGPLPKKKVRLSISFYYYVFFNTLPRSHSTQKYQD